MRRYFYSIIFLLAVVGLSSCKKLDYDKSFTKFVDVYFKNNAALAGNLGVKYAGKTIDWESDGKIKVVEGEGTFEFYDKRSGSVLGNKTITVTASQVEEFIVFQPNENDPVAILDPDAQAKEPVPGQDFMKIKVANYSTDLLPYEKTDVVVIGITSAFEFVTLATIESVGQNLDQETYHLIPTGGSDVIAWTFSFVEHGTNTKLKNAAGEDYINVNSFLYPDEIQPRPEKNIYTIYFNPVVRSEDPIFLKLNDIYYDIQPTVLFAD
ncbi:MAG TPA: hypothetical protein VK541_13425 [Pedobacter sp.]|uniref:hypothetical protein n=1 Tax=Pedobacter sp. TaxID=1411316 RepID=UPI002B76A8C7|nr:hypothetical protein [Pedobacter sp.]HMI03484.1 hypothetical protein [Pedobacter sp.]